MASANIPRSAQSPEPTDQFAVRPQTLMFVFLGECIHPAPVCVYAGSVIDVFARVGVSEHATRSTLTRMVGRGLLSRQRQGRRMYYGIPARTTALLTDGLDRALTTGAVNHDWDGSWTLLAFSMPDAWQRQRRDLRSQLIWAGFGPLQGGLWIAPGSPDVRTLAAGLGLEDRVRVFRARADELTDINQLVGDAYDLDGLARRYRTFADRWTPVAGITPVSPLHGDPARDALAARLLLITEWLQTIRRDPHLPVRHLPPDWPAAGAQQIFLRLWQDLSGAAAQLAEQVLDTVPDQAAGAPAGQDRRPGPLPVHRVGALTLPGGGGGG